MKFCDLQPKTPGMLPVVTFNNNEASLFEPRTDVLSPTQEGKPPTPPPGHSAGTAHASSSRSFSAPGSCEHLSHSHHSDPGSLVVRTESCAALKEMAGRSEQQEGTSRKGALVQDGSQPRPLPPASVSAAGGGSGQPQAPPGPPVRVHVPGAGAGQGGEAVPRQL